MPSAKLTAGQKTRMPENMHSRRVKAIREKILQAMVKEGEQMINAQMKAAKGEVILWKTDPDGKTTTMNTAPDVQAAKLLLDYSGAKPVEEIKHTGGIGLIHLVASLEHGDTDSN